MFMSAMLQFSYIFVCVHKPFLPTHRRLPCSKYIYRGVPVILWDAIKPHDIIQQAACTPLAKGVSQVPAELGLQILWGRFAAAALQRSQCYQ